MKILSGHGRGISDAKVLTTVDRNRTTAFFCGTDKNPRWFCSLLASRGLDHVNVTVGEDVTLDDVQHAIDYITEAAGADQDNDVNIIFGVQMDSSFADSMKIAIIATDFAKDVELNSSPALTRRSTPTEEKALAPTPAYQKPIETGKSRVEREIQEEKQDSVLPDYLRTLLQRNEEKTSEGEKQEEEEK